ncbi:MAG: glycoside hydrolase family 3 N-terminal domain-containing protein [Raineya sp.]|nr:glycoside hydrolase family 3 N-terminal domain-containing protein [Raineya sp.]
MYKKLIAVAFLPALFPLLTLFENPKISETTEKYISPYLIFFSQEERWVDSVFRRLSLDEKIGQLFMVAAYSNKDEKHYREIEKLIKDYHIGGLIFFQGSPYKQAQLTNRYQAKSEVPLLIAIDAEWGLAMRLDSTLMYPYQITLGALRAENDSLIEAMGEQIGKQCKRLGVHINFAPVVDVNNNPANPVIGFRSFGENKEKVARKGIAYMRGLQKAGIMAVAKHFPGHGDTDQDSHYALPQLKHNTERLDSLELYPFRKLIEAGVQGIMVAHLNIPAYETRPNYATTLSENVIKNLLVQKMGFSGLIFTDALNMKGVSDYFPPGELEVLALQAGNDVLLFPTNIPLAVKAIKKALKKKEIKKEDFERSVKKILRAKYRAGLNKYEPIVLEKLTQDLNPEREYNTLAEQIYLKAITMARNQDSLVPFVHLDLHRFVSVAINASPKSETIWQEMLDNYTEFEHLSLQTAKESWQNLAEKLQKLDSTKTAIVGIFGMSRLATKKYGIDSLTIKIVKEIQRRHAKTLLCIFGNPYSLQFFDAQNVLIAYEENEFTLKYVPQMIFGAFGIEGEMPVSVGKIREGDGQRVSSIARLQYGFSPESVGMSSDTLRKMDTLIQNAILNKVFPGCQVLVARKGKVIWHKAYGYHDYEGTQKVTLQSIYDLASISKVAGTTQALMFLFDVGKLDLSLKASEYLPELAKSNKKNMVIHDILLHQAGLKPYELFYKRMLGKMREPSEKYFRYTRNDTFCVQVAPNLFAHKDIEEIVWKWVIESDLLKKKGKRYPYEYSDLGFFIMKRIVDKLLNEPMDKFLRRNFYLPLGANTLCYKPLELFPKERIVPTENDRYFRRELIWGTVHDPTAALIGGVAGHAGLFGTANDLAKLLQMNLQKGYYGGIRYLVPETIDLFTSQTDSLNRRGLGWDKPPKNGIFAYISQFATPKSYGHAGYTGTVAWVEPEKELIIIFLSNRVYPYDNNRITKYHTRRKVQDIVYQALLE